MGVTKHFLFHDKFDGSNKSQGLINFAASSCVR